MCGNERRRLRRSLQTTRRIRPDARPVRATDACGRVLNMVPLLQQLIRVATRIDTKRFRVPAKIRHFALDRYDPGDTEPFVVKKGTRKLLDKSVHRLFELAELLYAQNRWSVLFVFQAMDGAGKDSVIKHVLRGLDPKATQVFSFKTPSSEELKHDFMWRCMKSLPERGRLGIFNRSYYEEVLVSRVHPELLEQRQLPACCVTPHIWRERCEDISAIERYLTRNGTVIRKIFLNVSKAEQRRRFLARLTDPGKRWKFSLNDVNERLRWTEYMAAYEKAIKATTTDEAPWYVVPADNKWFARQAVAAIAIETLEGLDLKVPTLSHHDRRAISNAKRRLRAK
jgi:PPK2 family polyphosphate:nucleotide phosphotransferase